jgi:hypothetical protein
MEAYERRKEKLTQEVDVLSLAISTLAPIYLQNVRPEAQRMLETTVGAALWYLTKLPELWSGFASRQLLEEFGTGNVKVPITDDHFVPRKIAARKLLGADWKSISNPSLFLMDGYLNLYGKYHRITPSENRRLMKFQSNVALDWTDVQACWNYCYRMADVNLVMVSPEEFKQCRKGNRSVIRDVLDRKIGWVR